MPVPSSELGPPTLSRKRVWLPLRTQVQVPLQLRITVNFSWCYKASLLENRHQSIHIPQALVADSRADQKKWYPWRLSSQRTPPFSKTTWGFQRVLKIQKPPNSDTLATLPPPPPPTPPKMLQGPTLSAADLDPPSFEWHFVKRFI